MSLGDSSALSGSPPISNPPQSSTTISKSDSGERFRGDVASLDAVSLESEVGESKKESAHSAFVITSVEPAPDDDLDTTRAPPTSMDESLRAKIESGESEEETVSLSEEQHTPTTPSDSGETEPSMSGGLSSSSTVDMSRGQQVSSSGNGPSVQPGGGRFRKVNKYSRGRWTVRDMETTEERSGTEIARHTSLGGSKTNILESGSNSPSVGRKTEQQDSLHSRSGSELGPVPSTSTAGDNVSDKDSTSIHLDRSSTAADTLSRNTSLSSINAPDERSADVDIDVQTSGVGVEVSEPSYPAPHTSTLTETSSENATMSSTTELREHPISHLNGPMELSE